MSKRYPLEVREKATRLALDRLDEYGLAYAVAHVVGPMVDVHPETLRVWIVKALKEQFAQGEPAVGGLAAVERTELDRLRKENRELKQANEILKLASAFFARELDRDTVDRRVHRRVPPGLRRRVDLCCAVGARHPDRAQDLPQSPLAASIGS